MIKNTTYRDAKMGIKSTAKLLMIALAFIVLASFNQASAQDGSVNVPIGTDSYKLEVSEDGIYQVTYEELKAAGMDVDNIDPNTFEMMHQGEPIAYQLSGNGDNVFEAGEAVRFFGWAFDGSTHDGWYVDSNYYWLWANGTPTVVDSRASFPGGTAVDTWRSTIVFEQENHFNSTKSNDWDTFEFEGDSWFIARMGTNPAGVDLAPAARWSNTWDVPNADLDITPEMGFPFREYAFEVIDPIATGADAEMTTEVFSLCSAGEVETHTFAASLNGVQQIEVWDGPFGRSFSQPIPASTLIDGDNALRYDALTPQEDIKFAKGCGTDGFNNDWFLPNRSILEYDRELMAVDDELLFSYGTSGSHDFMVSGFTTGVAADAVVWDVTDRTMPSVVTLSDADITDDGGSFTWTIGDENLADGQYMVTTMVKTPIMTQYVAPNITAADVEWLAISHANFMEQAERMAAYRGGTPTDVTLSDGTTVNVTVEVPRETLVVDIADVVNQYGYGYNIPQTIQAYYQDAYRDWANGELKYGILFGDATINPLQRDCLEQCDGYGEWDATFETFIPTDMQFDDRFNGLIPVDHTYANLVDDGSTLGASPEIAVGRFAVNTLGEAETMVDKVVLYEYNQQEGAEYLENLVFIADAGDGGGDFCQTTRAVTDERDYIDSFTTFADGTAASGGAPYCMDDYIPEGEVESNTYRFLVRDDVLSEINSTGAAIVNYRGHGSRFELSNIINANREIDDTVVEGNGGQLVNNDKPMVWISADCLDGDFAYPTARLSALSERMMRLEGLTGTAGHWSSTGLGFDREHTALHQGFYEALYTLNEDGEPRGPYTIGDAIVYSKDRYLENNLGNVAEIWAFTFQGDPAMAMPDAEYVAGYGDQLPSATALSSTDASTTIYLPIIAVIGAVVVTTLTVTNVTNRRHNLID